MVFCEMYFLARFSEKPETRNYEGYEVTINQKEFIFGRLSWSNRLGISERRLRTLIKKLVEEGFIKQRFKHSKFTVYSFEYVPEMNLQSDQQNVQQNVQQDFKKRPAELQAGQGISGTSDQQEFAKRPAECPAERPQKEEGIKEEGYKGECLNNMPSENNKPIAKEILSYLNQKTNKKFRATDNTLKYIMGRLGEGYTQEDCVHVIDVKCAEWLGTKQEQYLDYETLFRPTKFPKYLQQQLSVINQPDSSSSNLTRSQRANAILDQELRKEGERGESGRRDITHEANHERLPEFRD
jgi:uncharacterized phage protein (TIGR02220 family)